MIEWSGKGDHWIYQRDYSTLFGKTVKPVNPKPISTWAHCRHPVRPWSGFVIWLYVNCWIVFSENKAAWLSTAASKRHDFKVYPAMLNTKSRQKWPMQRQSFKGIFHLYSPQIKPYKSPAVTALVRMDYFSLKHSVATSHRKIERLLVIAVLNSRSATNQRTSSRQLLIGIHKQLHVIIWINIQDEFNFWWWWWVGSVLCVWSDRGLQSNLSSLPDKRYLGMKQDSIKFKESINKFFHSNYDCHLVGSSRTFWLPVLLRVPLFDSQITITSPTPTGKNFKLPWASQ